MALRANNPVLQFLNDEGKPIANGTLNTYRAGTSTPVATFNDRAMTTRNPVSIPLDNSGCPCDVWFEDGMLYKLVVKDSEGRVWWTKDYVDGLTDIDIPVYLCDDAWEALCDEDGETLVATM